MVELVLDEKTTRFSSSNFLKFEGEQPLEIRSHLVYFFVAFNPATKRTMLWEDGLPFIKRPELYYYVKLGEQEGILRLPVSVNNQISKSEKMLKKNRRLIKWIVSKEGSGKETRYNVINAGDAQPLTDEQLKENDEKLLKACEVIEKRLKEELENYKFSQLKNKEDEQAGTENVEPEDIPF